MGEQQCALVSAATPEGSGHGSAWRDGACPITERSPRAVDQPRILIVDDDPDVLEALEDLLSFESNCEIGTAPDCESARRMAATIDPSIALIDVKLGSENGIELISELKRQSSRIACIVMTAYHSSEYAVQALRSGADEFLYKPLVPEDLLRTVERTLERRRLQSDKEESDRRFRAVFDQSFQFLFVLKPDGTIVEANGTVLAAGPVDRGDVVGRAFWEAPWWRDIDATRAILKNAVREAAGGRAVRHEVRIEIDGIPATIDLSLKPVLDENGEVVLLIPEARDISERKATEEKLRLSAKVFDHAAEGIAITDAQVRILDVNPGFSEITGFGRDEALGRTPKFLAGADGADDTGDIYQRILREAAHCGRWQGETWGRRRAGERFPMRLSVSAVHDNEGSLANYVVLASDNTNLRKAQDRQEYLAHYDALTDVANRALFANRLKLAISRAARLGVEFALLDIDIDRFKHVNDTLGHQTGDELLVEVAKQLGGLVRTEDTVARLGGDEFVLILREVEDLDATKRVARRVLGMLSEPLLPSGSGTLVSASMGIAVYPRDGTDGESLLNRANAAMYAAKTEGRNCYRFFDATTSERSRERMRLEIELRHALKNQELYVVYQPKWSLTARRMVGVEALARWRHAELGLVPPSSFIPVAEDTGLIGAIGEFVLRTACRQAKRWQRAGNDVPVAVNLSAHQLCDPGIISRVKQILSECGLPPGLLELELTESSIIHDLGCSIKMLSDLRKLGIRVSIDDFGTGYSSLSQLRQLPVDSIKIDRSFLAGLDKEGNVDTVVETIMSLARSLRLKVVAEGVETPAQLSALGAYGCHEVQGFLLGKPVSADKLEQQIGRIPQVWQDVG